MADTPYNVDESLHLSVRFSSSNYTGQDWPERYFTEESATLHVSNIDIDGPTTQVGELRFQVADVASMINDRCPLWRTFDITQELHELYCAVFGEDEDPKPAVLRAAGFEDEERPNNFGLLHLDWLRIEPRFQGHNLGLVLMREVIQRRRASAGLVLLQAFPLYAKDRMGQEMTASGFSQARRKLYAHFGKLGFERISRATGEGFMVRNTCVAPPEEQDLLAQDWEEQLRAALTPEAVSA